MQKTPFLKIHGAHCKYLEMSATYINECNDNAQIISVTMFLVILYNACFMYQSDKRRSNLLVTALNVFDLEATVKVDKFMNTMSDH